MHLVGLQLLPIKVGIKPLEDLFLSMPSKTYDLLGIVQPFVRP